MTTRLDTQPPSPHVGANPRFTGDREDGRGLDASARSPRPPGPPTSGLTTQDRTAPDSRTSLSATSLPLPTRWIDDMTGIPTGPDGRGEKLSLSRHTSTDACAAQAVVMDWG